MANETYLSRKAAADYLTSIGCPLTWHRLSVYAMYENAGHGPPYIKVRKNGPISYAKSDLDAWAKANARRIV